MTVYNGIYEWDSEKEEVNIKKHHIDFKTAIMLFNDDCYVDIADRKHSQDEERHIVIGIVEKVMYLVTAVYTPRGDRIRIISARKATPDERRMYNAYNNNS